MSAQCGTMAWRASAKYQRRQYEVIDAVSTALSSQNTYLNGAIALNLLRTEGMHGRVHPTFSTITVVAVPSMTDEYEQHGLCINVNDNGWRWRGCFYSHHRHSACYFILPFGLDQLLAGCRKQKSKTRQYDLVIKIGITSSTARTAASDTGSSLSAASWRPKLNALVIKHDSYCPKWIYAWDMSYESCLIKTFKCNLDLVMLQVRKIE